VSALSNRDAGVDVTYSDGTAGRFDLVVGADSVFSGVRKIAFPHMGEAEPTGQGCWRISIRRPPGLHRGEFYFGHEYPVGITPCGKDAVYMWMLTPHVAREDFFSDEELFDTLKANLAPFGGNAGWIRDNMTRGDWINYRPLAARLQPRPWSNGRIVLLGDAVHATTPHLASGAGMAVESAIVLAEELMRTRNVLAAINAYELRRFPRCKDVVDTSLDVGRIQLAGGSPDVVGAKIGAAIYRLACPF
jgi:2-polyprenyl-6-methoxyphenol hydroxylase-like FAD-dependent oxidoreductase